MSNTEAKYDIRDPKHAETLKAMCEGLLKFGRRFPSPGGSAWYLGDDGTPWPDRPRETYATARMVHVYSIGKLLGFPGSEDLAKQALRGLKGELRDTEHGGWYSGRTADGGVLPNKLCYAHAFVILAASSAMIADIDGAGELLEDALRIYDEKFWNEEEGLSADTWDTDFALLDDYRGLNANMHTVEAFLGAADATGDDTCRRRASRIIDRVLGWAAANDWRIPEHYTSGWEPDLERNHDRPDDAFKPYGATPGHGLEWARLIVQWALSAHRDDPEGAKPYIEKAEALFARAVGDAWNADGAPGIVYTTDWNGKPVVHDRMHWTLAEAINTAAVLWQVTGKEVYADRYAEFMEYLYACVLDPATGSWFHQLDADNRPSGTVWPGKPDVYHALQATLIPLYPADTSIALSVKKGLLA